MMLMSLVKFYVLMGVACVLFDSFFRYHADVKANGDSPWAEFKAAFVVLVTWPYYIVVCSQALIRGIKDGLQEEE